MNIRLTFLLALALLAGCATAPAPTDPHGEVPTAWQAALPHDGSTQETLDWWAQFNDPILDELLRRAEADSPSLAEALARIDEARAAVTVTRANGLPAVNAGVANLRSGDREAATPVLDTTAVAADASWEIDLFGRVRHATDAAKARVEARQDDWHEARISLAAEVANTYVGYRACELQVAYYRQDAASQESTAKLTGQLAGAGFNPPSDKALADASLADTRERLAAQEMECNLQVKALVALTGVSEKELRAGLDVPTAGDLPVPRAFTVATLPAALLAQRPDLAAAERSLAAAEEEIGAAQANRYPRLSLLGNISANTVSGGVDTTPWSFGPSLTFPVFDAGSRAAQVDAAVARRDQALAQYRQKIRDAVREVEQALVRLDSADRRESQARAAAKGYRAYFDAAQIYWQAGSGSLLAAEVARRTAINAERNLIDRRREHVQYWIELYKALGGGWQSQPAGADQGASS